MILQMCSCDQSLVTLALLWKKLSQPQFYKDLTRKTAFFEGWSWFKFNNLGLTLGTDLKFYTSVVKGLKLKVRKFLGLFPTFAEVTEEKLVGGGAFCFPLSWIGLRCKQFRSKGVLRKHLCQRPATLLKKRLWSPATLLKKRLCHRCFRVNFVKFPRTPFLQNSSRRLLLIDWEKVAEIKR